MKQWARKVLECFSKLAQKRWDYATTDDLSKEIFSAVLINDRFNYLHSFICRHVLIYVLVAK